MIWVNPNPTSIGHFVSNLSFESRATKRVPYKVTARNKYLRKDYLEKQHLILTQTILTRTS